MMQSVTEAKTIVHRLARTWHASACGTEVISCHMARSRVLASDLLAPISVPAFDNSAMDGFAIHSADTCSASTTSPTILPITAEACAGSRPTELCRGQAIRIMTGAAIPTGATAVIAKEHIEERDGTILISAPVRDGNHIRRIGEDIQSGTCALAAGSRLDPNALAFIATLGIDQIPVAKIPRIAVLATGHELTPPGAPLEAGKIFESNTTFLVQHLAGLGTPARRVRVIGDTYDLICRELSAALAEHDLVVLSGGVSVGEYDYTRRALEELGVTEHFWKVAQKPGKPLSVGQCRDTLVTALPGNPYAVAVCFHVYLRPMILAMMGATPHEPRRFKLPIQSSIRKEAGRTTYLKGRFTVGPEGTKVEPLRGQGSHQMHALISSDCLIELPADQTEVTADTLVEVILLP